MKGFHFPQSRYIGNKRILPHTGTAHQPTGRHDNLIL